MKPADATAESGPDDARDADSATCRWNRWAVAAGGCVAAWAAPIGLEIVRIALSLVWPGLWMRGEPAREWLAGLQGALIRVTAGPVLLAFRWSGARSLGTPGLLFATACQWALIAGLYAYLIVRRGRLTTPTSILAAVGVTMAVLAMCAGMA